MADINTTLVKDPDGVLDYGFDWSAWLVADTISTSVWTVPVGLTEDSESETTTTTTIWLSGGTPGQLYTITNRVVTAGGRTDDRSFKLRVQER